MQQYAFPSTPNVSEISRVQGKLVRLADDVSCAAVPVVSFITAFYYCLLLSGNIVDSDDVRLFNLHCFIS